MTLNEIQRFVASVDSGARHYVSREESVDFTRWQELRRLPVMGEGRHAEEAWAFQIDRFTRSANDPVCQAFVDALEAAPRIAWQKPAPIYEPDTGYIHHIFLCEGV